MTNVRKLMGRLNPATCRFDVGRGGIPELTPQDLAGALGMVQDEFAREVFCALWWPDGAKLTLDSLIAKINAAVMSEYSRRCLQSQMAKLDLHIAEADAHARRSLSEHDRRQLAGLRMKAEQTRAAQWPWNPEVYSRLPRAIITELRHDNLCSTCGGTGFIAPKVVEGPTVACRKCSGQGQAPAPKTERAKMLGISESAYRGVWSGAYEWTLDFVSGMEREAARRLSEAIGSGQEAA